MRWCTGSSSRLGRPPAVGAGNWQVLCTTSRLGRDWLVRTGNGRGVSAGRGVGPSRRLSQGGILRGPISPKQGRCVRITCFSGRKVGVSPEQGRCVAEQAHRLGLGEIGWFGLGRAAAFLQVGAPVLLADSPKAGSCAARSLPSKDVAPRSPKALALDHRPALGEVGPDRGRWFSRARTLRSLRRTIVPSWEGRARCMRVFLPTRGVVRSNPTIVPLWKKRACRACEKRRCRVRALVPSRAAMRAALGVPPHPAPPRSPKGLKLAEAYLLRSGCIAQCADAGAGIL